MIELTWQPDGSLLLLVSYQTEFRGERTEDWKRVTIRKEDLGPLRHQLMARSSPNPAEVKGRVAGQHGRGSGV